MAKQRADQLLVDRGLAESRTRAQALILAGLAFVGDRKIDKAGQQVAADAAVSVKGRDHPWVSRGGIKLDHALTHLGYLSGLLLGIGLGFWSLVPGIERQGRAFSLLAAIVVVGGLARGLLAFRLGVATFRPSTADITEIAGVMTLSP